MRARLFICACALWLGGCLYPEYRVGDGGAAGAGGRDGGGAGAGAVGGAAGIAGAGGSVAGVAGRGGATGTGGVAGTGRGGTTGAAGTGGSFTGAAGSGTAGSSGGRGGSTGGTTGAGGRGGSAGGASGAGGLAGRGGSSAGTGGVSGRGGGNAGTGGSAGGSGGSTGGGSTPAPSWLPSLSVVYLFDRAAPNLGAEAHGTTALDLTPGRLDSSVPPPAQDTTAIEGTAAKFAGTLNMPSFFTSMGTSLPSVFQTGPNNSWTTGGWFRITASNAEQWLIHDEGPTNFEQGGFYFYLSQAAGTLSARTAYAYCRVGTQESTGNFKEVATDNIYGVGKLGFDKVASNGWIHLVCRYDAKANDLAIFAGGDWQASESNSSADVTSGPGPFMLGCNERDYCSFLGNMDEVFFTQSALSDADVKRIWACGIDGSRCSCNGPDWANCGYEQASGCDILPHCDANP